MPGGAQAVREPWRNDGAPHWQIGTGRISESMAAPTSHAIWRRSLCRDRMMIRGGVNAPLASSCGRLFDAVAAALGHLRRAPGSTKARQRRLEALGDRRCRGHRRLSIRDDDALVMRLVPTSMFSLREKMWMAGASGDDEARRRAGPHDGRACSVEARASHGTIAARTREPSPARALSRRARFDHRGAVGRVLQNACCSSRPSGGWKRASRADPSHGAGQRWRAGAGAGRGGRGAADGVGGWPCVSVSRPDRAIDDAERTRHRRGRRRPAAGQHHFRR